MPCAALSDLRLYYEDSGKGHPIIWLHEFAADYRTWEGQVRYFGRDYRCITYNARGYPPSDVPEHGDAYRHDKQRDDLLALMDYFDVERAHLVGLSMGAYTGLQFALKYPQRTSALLFASGGSGGMPTEQAQFRRDTEEAAERMLRDGMAAAADGLAMGATRVQLLNKDPRSWDEFRRYLAEHSVLGSALTLRNYQALRPPLGDFEVELRALDVPVLLAFGDEDDPVIEANILLKRTLPRAGIWVHPKSGHGLNLEEPGPFNEMAAKFFHAVERGDWHRRDARANPGQSVFMGDNRSNNTQY
jgi:pimeloyl-ACP methyl ester carboxylesterase